MSIVLDIQNLSKQYTIKENGKKQVFTALHNLNLQVKKGTVLGVIGHNGAGKSTLLKILSRISYPSSGEVYIRGKLSSLLEVGTGFHPELTGRENVFLNGAILGMKRQEITSKFDEIVAFSGVEKFIDTPVKHYSSGMYVRLAFSVAAHLHADVLLVDEVLAVGDAEFQKKCLGKMDEATKSGTRTIVFVSHNLRAIRDLCDEVLWLEKGAVKQIGKAKEVVNAYLSSVTEHASRQALHQRTDREGKGLATFTEVRWQTPNHNMLICGEKAQLVAHYTGSQSNLTNLSFRLNVHTSDGAFLTSFSNQNSGFNLAKAPGSGSILCTIPKLPFLAGEYSINLNLYANGELQDRVRNAFTFKVQEGDFFGSGQVKKRITEGMETPQTWSLMP